MDIDWKVVPERFRYLQQVVELCGETRIWPYNFVSKRHISFAERTTKEQLDCLASVQSEIVKRDDLTAIHKWCKEASNNTESEREVSGLIEGILGVLEQLSEANIPPFCNIPFELTELEDIEPIEENEASKLPEDLRYLIGPALHYGERYGDELQMLRFFEEASDHEQDTLAALAERVRINRDWPKILQWLKNVGYSHISYNWEIDNLFHLMDLCDFKFEPE